MTLSQVNIKIFTIAVNIFRKFFYDSYLHRSGLLNSFYKKWVDNLRSYSLDSVNYKGAKFLLPAHDITILPTLITGTYEEFEIDTFLRFLNSTDTIFDVGANIGIYSILISKKLGFNDCKVISFEPEPENIKMLKQNISINNCKNIKIVEKAVGNEIKNIKFYLSDESIGSHSAVGHGKKYIEVPQVTLDDWSDEQNILPSVMKIDVEGYESYVLQGSSNILKNVRYLMMEYIPPQELSEKITTEERDKLIKLLSDNFSYFYLIRNSKIESIDIQKLLNHSYGNLLVSKQALDI